MSYSINGKVYTDHALMDEVVYYTKIIMNSVILKNSTEADENETAESLEASDFLLAIDNGSMELSFFPLDANTLIKFGYSSDQVKLILDDRSQIPSSDKKALLKFCCDQYVANYVEMNNYYRTLNGLPYYDTTEYDVYVNRRDPRFEEEDITDIRFDLPIHEYSNDMINTLVSLGILDEIIESHPGKAYKYLKFLGSKKIDILTARKAANWDIIYIPNVEPLVLSRFKELYTVNREIYEFRTFQDAYKYSSEYYDEFMMITILCQTFADMVVDIPEWFIRRDVFDLRTCEYFLESQGVKFFKQIPLKYQIRIVKNLNKLIRFKSTNKNIEDILAIFGVEGTKVYKYYLFKKYLYTSHEQEIEPEPDHEWDMWDDMPFDCGYEDDYEGLMFVDHVDPDIDFGMEEEYDFGDEEYDSVLPDADQEFNFPLTIDPELELHKYDFGTYLLPSIDIHTVTVFDFNYEDETEEIDNSIPQRIYEFMNESESEIPPSEYTRWIEEQKEERRIVRDIYGNIYDLEFVKVPIGESYDDYIKDNKYRIDYDAMVEEGPYWDGEDIHALVRNKHLEKDFTIEGTKYMSLEYKVSMKEYLFQICYFMSMIFYGAFDTSKIEIPVPQIKENSLFGLTDLCILIYCLSEAYEQRSIKLKQPTIRTTAKPKFTKYYDFNGGMFFDGGEPDPIPEPEPEPEWEMEPIYDFGDEEFDDNIYDPLYGEMFDFGYNYTINPNYELHDYDFGNMIVTLVDFTEYELPTPDGFLVGSVYDFLDENYDEEPYPNYVGDCDDYDFRDEDDPEIPELEIVPNTRFYDFRSFNRYYIDYVEPPIPPEPEYVEHWWDNETRHPFEVEVFGGETDAFDAPVFKCDGGYGEYSEITQESYYEWMKNDHSNWFVPLPGRIYGYNLTVDLKKLEEEISTRHSAFGFEHGYTLADFGCDGFQTQTEFATIDEMLSVYRANAEAYHNLEEMMINGVESRDQYVTMNYVFNMLFTIPYDIEFYRLRSGELANSYDEILKERNYTLYRFYKDIMKEDDAETRIDNIRGVLNDIVNTLEYYIKSDDTKFVFYFVPTNSLASIVTYIGLMINFFKSWKVHFLDPKVSYELDDKRENKVGYADQITETKVKSWYLDNSVLRDTCTIKPKLYFEEYALNKEVIDFYSFYEECFTEIYDADGSYADADDYATIDLSQFLYIVGGNSLDVQQLTVHLSGGDSSLINLAVIAILDGGRAVDIKEWPPMDPGSYFSKDDLAKLIKFYDFNGGEFERDEEDPEDVKDASGPFVMVNGGSIASRRDVYDIDGGGSAEYDNYMDIDGLHCFGPNNGYDHPRANDFKLITYDVDGGIVSTANTLESKTIKTVLYDESLISQSVKHAFDEGELSSAGLIKESTNDIVIKHDGLYFGGDFASKDEYTIIKRQMQTERYTYLDELNAMLNRVMLFSDESYVNNYITGLFDGYFAVSNELLLGYKRNTVVYDLYNYTSNSVADLKKWFVELDLFSWSYL